MSVEEEVAREEEKHPLHDRPDFRLIFETECSFAWRVLRRLGLPEREVEDAVQDVFLVVHRHLGDYDPSRPLRPWLFGICYRVAIAHRRKARTRKEQIEDTIEPVDGARPADEQIAAMQAQQLVRKALDTLELDRRAIFVMVEYEGYSMPEIAETLGIPLNTAYSRLRLAREQFVVAVRRLQAQSPKEMLRAAARGGTR
ncbi:MAG: RNA polymerase sigma factor [Polyangiales bacterium]